MKILCEKKKAWANFEDILSINLIKLFQKFGTNFEEILKIST